LETVLSQTFRFLDFHQTSQASEMPFFIFPYCREGFDFARLIDYSRAIVTHWGDSFSSEGICTDEYVNAAGGIGISYELGQNGFDPYQIALGTTAAIAACLATAQLISPNLQPSLTPPGKSGPIYSWGAIVPWPPTGNPVLDPGWHNFRAVVKGERLGEIDGKPIVAEASGRMLFAKYLDTKAAGASKRPTELYRIMKEITQRDLPSE
jgi:hypothetical protein